MKRHMPLFFVALVICLVPPIAAQVLALGLDWIPDAFDYLGPLKVVVAVAVGGSLATAGMLAVVTVLDLPFIRTAWGGFLWGLGKTSSVLLIRWFGKYGQQIEDKLQNFGEFSQERYFAGLDQDDRRKPIPG